MTDWPSLAAQVAANAETAALLDAVRHLVAYLGEADEIHSTSQVAFRRSRTVVRVRAPGQSDARPAAQLELVFEFDERDGSHRWASVELGRSGRFIHVLEVRDGDDLDDDVLGWLRTAWSTAE